MGRTFVKEFFSALLITIALPLALFFGRYYGGKGHRPVVLVHGYFLTRTTWIYFVRLLRRRGINAPIYAFSYNCFGCITTAAKELAVFVERVAEKEGVDRVDVVCHSIGALVSRWYLEKLGGLERLGRLIQLSPNNQGNYSASYAIGISSLDCAPASWLVVALGAPPEDVPYTVVWSRSDEIIVPWQYARLEPYLPQVLDEVKGSREVRGSREVDEVQLTNLGHLTALVSPRTADVVVDRLRTPPPRR